MPACGANFNLFVFKSMFHLFAALTWEISTWTLEDKIRSYSMTNRSPSHFMLAKFWPQTTTWYASYSRFEEKNSLLAGKLRLLPKNLDLWKNYLRNEKFLDSTKKNCWHDRKRNSTSANNSQPLFVSRRPLTSMIDWSRLQDASAKINHVYKSFKLKGERLDFIFLQRLQLFSTPSLSRTVLLISRSDRRIFPEFIEKIHREIGCSKHA